MWWVDQSDPDGGGLPLYLLQGQDFLRGHGGRWGVAALGLGQDLGAEEPGQSLGWTPHGGLGHPHGSSRTHLGSGTAQ